MEGNNKIGIVSSNWFIILNQIDQFAGSLGINMYTGRGFAIGHKELTVFNMISLIKPNWLALQ
jgi:hypothetical protein